MPYPFDMTFNLDAAANAQGLYGDYQMNPNMQRSMQQQRVNALIAPMAMPDNGSLIQQGLGNNGAALGLIGGVGEMSQPQKLPTGLGGKLKTAAFDAATGGNYSKWKNKKEEWMNKIKDQINSNKPNEPAPTYEAGGTTY